MKARAPYTAREGNRGYSCQSVDAGWQFFTSRPADNWSTFLFGSGVCNVGFGLVSGSELINPIFVVDNSTDSQN